MSGPTIVPRFHCRVCGHVQGMDLLSSRQGRCTKCRSYSASASAEGIDLDDGKEHGLETTWRDGRIVSVRWV